MITTQEFDCEAIPVTGVYVLPRLDRSLPELEGLVRSLKEGLAALTKAGQHYRLEKAGGDKPPHVVQENQEGLLAPAAKIVEEWSKEVLALLQTAVTERRFTEPPPEATMLKPGDQLS